MHYALSLSQRINVIIRWLKLVYNINKCTMPFKWRNPRRGLIVAMVILSSVSLFSYLVITGNFEMQQVIRLKMLFVSKSSAPLWMTDNADMNCLPKSNIAFLKTHKCASSAIQNILLRYGEKHSLLFALPPGNYFGGGTRYVQPFMFKAGIQNQLGFNIYAIHSRWNMTVMESVMPSNTVFVSIVREPSGQFESLFEYTDMKKDSGYNFSDYIHNVGVHGKRRFNFVGYNQMMWDFGLPTEQFENITAVKDMIHQADNLFHLVMVAERMPESLVLLRRLLCADNEDVITLKLNARKTKEKQKNKLSPETKALLRERLAPDYLLYNHFVEKFQRLVESYGEWEMRKDIKELDRVIANKEKDCGYKQVNATDLKNEKIIHKEKMLSYKSESTEPTCQAIIRSELKYLDVVRKHQKAYVIKTLRSNPNLVQSLGPGGISLEPPEGSKKI